MTPAGSRPRSGPPGATTRTCSPRRRRGRGSATTWPGSATAPPRTKPTRGRRAPRGAPRAAAAARRLARRWGRRGLGDALAGLGYRPTEDQAYRRTAGTGAGAPGLLAPCDRDFDALLGGSRGGRG